VTTTTSAPTLSSTEAAQLAATRERLDLEYAHIAELRRELQRCEGEVRRLANLAYWQLARMCASEEARH
jgi:hypothetical protein